MGVVQDADARFEPDPLPIRTLRPPPDALGGSRPYQRAILLAQAGKVLRVNEIECGLAEQIVRVQADDLLA
jgi:hypothetical protein